MLQLSLHLIHPPPHETQSSLVIRWPTLSSTASPTYFAHCCRLPGQGHYLGKLPGQAWPCSPIIASLYCNKPLRCPFQANCHYMAKYLLVPRVSVGNRWHDATTARPD